MANPRKRRGDGSRSPLRVPDVAVPLGRDERRPVILPGVALAAGIILFVFLLRFAVDILLWVLVLVLFALVLHALMVWLAQSELLSAPWLLIIVLTLGAGTWMVWPGSSFQEGLDVTHYLPSPLVQILEWAERRSLTRRALVATPAPAGESATGSRAAAPPSESAPTGGVLTTLSVSIALTGAAASRVGEPVPLVATVRAGGRSRAEFAGVVQFFDGLVPLGEATLQAAGSSRRASLTVTGLSAGVHRITASYAGATSAALTHTVAGG